METKLKITLWTLFVIYSGSVVHSQDQAASFPPSPADRSAEVSNTEAPDLVLIGPQTARPALTASLDIHTTPSQEESNTTATSNTTTGTNAKSDNSTSTAEDEAAVQHLSPQHHSEGNATGLDLPFTTFPKVEVNLTDESRPQPRFPPSENHTTIPHIPLNANTTTTTADHSLLNTTHTTTTPTRLTAPPQNTQPSSTRLDKPLHPTSPPSHSSQPTTHRPESQSTPGRGLSSTPPHPRPQTTMSVTSRPTSTSDPNRPHETTEMQPSHASHTTPDTNRLPGTSSPAHPKFTSAPAGDPSAKANAHADIPSQLNVGGDATVVHETPTLDPLLAGLVSAFIITAVIITLLLFLKLRRRDNQPEFRRLQDLPMDDMMEDTPLSMYSY